MRNDKLNEAGLTGSGGICIDGDIGLKFSHYHSPALYFSFRIFLAFLATFTTASLANSFTNAQIQPFMLFYDSAVAVLALSLLFSKHIVIKICAGLVTVMYLIPIVLHLNLVRYGFWAAANRYLTKGDLPEQSTGLYKHVLTTRAEVEQSLFYFFCALIFIEALGAVIACVIRIDFPVLFVFTFPVVELGLYLGFDVPTYAALMIIVSWVTLLSLNIINHTTNKAGRKNTFAVHERSKTFFFTSSEAKAEFYSVYIRFVALVTAAVFLLIVVFSKVSGFYRPDSFEELRYNLHHAVERFDLTHADDFLIDVNGGSNLFGVTTVGGTNGGVLGTTNGISFNGSKALILNTEKFNYSMYLRGYIAGSYEDNKWQPTEGDRVSGEVSDEMAVSGLWIQDQDFLLINGNETETVSHNAVMDITVKGACSKFVYAPYASFYSNTAFELGEEADMTPYNDSYVRISQSKKNYSFFYKSFDHTSWTERSKQLRNAGLTVDPVYRPTLEMYQDYVYDTYTEAVDIESLNKAYDYISKHYLDGSPENYTYEQIYSAIKSYFTDMKFTYNTNPGKTPEGRDFIEYFLTEQKKGYCTYFATVGTQLLRKFGFPARYVEGYMVLPGQLNNSPEKNGVYEVTVKDKCAHAWAEVYIDNVGWMPAEFTPGYDRDNPNLTQEEKGQKKTEDSSSESSKKEVAESSSKAQTSSSKAQSNSSKKSDTDSKKSSSSAKDSTSSKTDSNSKAQGGTPGGKGGGNGSPQETSPVVKTVCMTLVAIALGVAAVIINRRRSLAKMKESCTQADLNKRVMAIYSYSLKYLAAMNIEVKKNVSDMQLCNELLAKCHAQRIHELDEKLSELTVIAVKAHMSPDSITEAEAEAAVEIMRCIADDVVAKKLSAVNMLSAKYLYCLY
ncbi:transglutaminase-like domain-containing protein [Ruminococcus sp.]|uniref:transglutaminase-like domain-containing protein n=1 Tax=Ruminococcus sp. TaxID=41978 RepID=UPI0025E829EA|nr:transglutaminase-like domain-containing protein [Ruminococcus sp.]MBQ8965255.1 transglutaminase domain-containing protein [Ruminococcus sp.]